MKMEYTMKRTIAALLILTVMVPMQGGMNHTEDFIITMEPTWKDLDNGTKKFKSKWILAGTITFKKKAQEKIHLDRLHLQWDGPKIEHLMASLYTNECLEDFLPIQENLVCDGTWNSNQQKLMFNFEEKQLLTFKNCFFLVLTVTDENEPLLKNGKFDLITTILPEPLKECLPNGQLCLRYNTPIPSFNQNMRIAKLK